MLIFCLLDGQFALLGGVPVRYGYGEHTTGFGMIYRGCWESDKMNGRGTSCLVQFSPFL